MDEAHAHETVCSQAKARASTDASEARVSILLTEFERLRDELDSRTKLSSNIIALELGVLGAGIPAAIATKTPEAFTGVAFVTSALWLMWLDHAEQIYKIASYIALVIRPQLMTYDPAALGWETYLRILDPPETKSTQQTHLGVRNNERKDGADDQASSAAQHDTGRQKDQRALRPVRHATNVDTWVSMVFSAPPLIVVLILLWDVPAKPIGGESWRCLAEAAFCLFIWTLSVHHRCLFSDNRESINESINAAVGSDDLKSLLLGKTPP